MKELKIRNIDDEQLNQLKSLAKKQGYPSLNEFMLDQISEIIDLEALDAVQYKIQPIMNTLVSGTNELRKNNNQKLNDIYGKLVENGEILLSLFELLGFDEQENLDFEQPGGFKNDQEDE